MRAFWVSLGLLASAALTTLPAWADPTPAAARTTTQTSWTARRAFQERLQTETGAWKSGDQVHANQTYPAIWRGKAYVGNAVAADPAKKYDYYKAVVWEHDARGPGAASGRGPADIRVAVVPATEGLTAAQKVARTILSPNLTRDGAARVREHLAGGPAIKSIQLGDFVTKPGDRLAQRPVTRESGNLRYTVTFHDGTQRRYLVETDAKALVDGKPVLGKVFADKDSYRR